METENQIIDNTILDREFSLQFYGIYDLLGKVNKLKRLMAADCLKRQEALKKKGIKFEVIDEYGLLIDIGGLTKDQKKFVLSMSNLDNIYKTLGIKECQTRTK